MMFGLSGKKEGKATEGGIMSLETVRRLAWTAIVLFIMAIVFAFNHGPILAWLAANHTPLGIMLCIGYWAGGFMLASRQPADANCYGLLGGGILFGLIWIMAQRQEADKEMFPRLRDQIADFAVDHIASEEYRRTGGKKDSDRDQIRTIVIGEPRTIEGSGLLRLPARKP